MHEYIEALYVDGLISHEEASIANEAQDTGTANHTLGDEAEVLASAAPDVPMAAITGPGRKQRLRELRRYGVGIGGDGLYELQLPAAQHPTALEVVTRGIVRAGALPNGTTGMVTTHVSWASPDVVLPQWVVPGSDSLLKRLVPHTRAIEWMGHTTARRLMAPVTRARQRHSGLAWEAWNAKGVAGVYIQARAGQPGWGNSNRVEHRTFGLYSPDQSGQLLRFVYFIGRGVIAQPDTPLARITAEYEQWLYQYREDNGLPELPDEPLSNMGGFAVEALASYMGPYSEHLANADLAEPRRQITRVVEAITEELGMQNLTLPAFE